MRRLKLIGLLAFAVLASIGPASGETGEETDSLAESVEQAWNTAPQAAGNWRNFNFRLIRDPGPQSLKLFEVTSPMIAAKGCNFDLKSFLVAYARFEEVKALFLDYPSKLLFLAMFAAYSMIPVVPDIINRVNAWTNMAAQFAMADCQQMAQYATRFMTSVDSMTFARRWGCRMNSTLGPEAQLASTACGTEEGRWGGYLGWESQTARYVDKFLAKGPSEYLGDVLGSEALDPCNQARKACRDLYNACRNNGSGDCEAVRANCAEEKEAAECVTDAVALNDFFGGMVGIGSVDTASGTYTIGRTRDMGPAVVEMVRIYTAAAGKALSGAVAAWSGGGSDQHQKTVDYVAADKFLSRTPEGSRVHPSVIETIAYHCRTEEASVLGSWPIKGQCGFAIGAVARVFALEATLITISKAKDAGIETAWNFAEDASRQDIASSLMGAIGEAERALLTEFGYGAGSFNPTLHSVLKALDRERREVIQARKDTIGAGEDEELGGGDLGIGTKIGRKEPRENKSINVGEALTGGLACTTVWPIEESR